MKRLLTFGSVAFLLALVLVFSSGCGTINEARRHDTTAVTLHWGDLKSEMSSADVRALGFSLFNLYWINSGQDPDLIGLINSEINSRHGTSFLGRFSEGIHSDLAYKDLQAQGFMNALGLSRPNSSPKFTPCGCVANQFYTMCFINDRLNWWTLDSPAQINSHSVVRPGHGLLALSTKDLAVTSVDGISGCFPSIINLLPGKHTISFLYYHESYFNDAVQHGSSCEFLRYYIYKDIYVEDGSIYNISFNKISRPKSGTFDIDVVITEETIVPQLLNRKAASQGNDAKNNLQLQNSGASEREYDKASASLLEEWASAGDVKAQTKIAALYFDGKRGFPKDKAIAYKWALVAAASGDADAKSLSGEFELFMTPEEQQKGKNLADSIIKTPK